MINCILINVPGLITYSTNTITCSYPEENPKSGSDVNTTDATHILRKHEKFYDLCNKTFEAQQDRVSKTV